MAFGPAEEYRSLSADDLRVLREVGRHWASVLAQRGPKRTLPVDPTLGSFSRAPTPTRFGRFAPIQMFRPEAPDKLVATELGVAPESRLGLVLTRVKRLILGAPLESTAVAQERMRKLVALPVLSSDLLSSVAYGPEAMLRVLVLAGSATLGLFLPLTMALILLAIVVGLSYRQTIAAYPEGAGSYIVAGDNLGPRWGLAAAAGLMTDYVLTVSVSIASGVDAMTSAIPEVRPYAVGLGLAGVAILLAGNLRGVRQAGNLFATPTYAFLLAIFLLIAVGMARAAAHGFVAARPPAIKATESLGLLLILRAFTSGATSMTGIEAVSNAVPVFRPVEWRNARTTLTWMVGLLVVILAGLALLIHLDGIVPRPGETVLSQLAHKTFGRGLLYTYTQAVTMLILVLAANTAFNDFPRLLFFMARDCYAPRRFLHMGDRLAFSNGIIALAVSAAVIFIAFHGRTESLIPLYAVGVFLAFTLSQTGMVVHWWRNRGAHWRKSIAFNSIGALASGLVLFTAGITKFTEGAWVVIIGIPLLIVTSLRIHHHYETVRNALALRPPPEPAVGRSPAPVDITRPGGDAGPRPAVGEEEQESPDEIRILTIVPVARLNRAALRALAYATSLCHPVLAVHISPDEEEAEWFRELWNTWGDHVPLEIIVSPYRAIVAPLAHYLEALHV
ncbi:MAG: amino acid permease-associated region, partial [Streptosporangiaceae bacterium]|nr:amino acid permease-associated region [Streptosporangiaceae bacterium]